MTHDEMIAVIQAHKEGKQIEFRAPPIGRWCSASSPSWEFSRYEYRVAKTKKVGYIVLANSDSPGAATSNLRTCSNIYYNKDDATCIAARNIGHRIVKVEWEE